MFRPKRMQIHILHDNAGPTHVPPLATIILGTNPPRKYEGIAGGIGASFGDARASASIRFATAMRERLFLNT